MRCARESYVLFSKQDFDCAENLPERQWLCEDEFGGETLGKPRIIFQTNVGPWHFNTFTV
jgi:hypothetical protein